MTECVTLLYILFWQKWHKRIEHARRRIAVGIASDSEAGSLKF
jgi:hypothetical protein